LGFSQAKHSTEVNINKIHVDWSTFIFKEELIRWVIPALDCMSEEAYDDFRTQTFIFLLDTAFTIFHNIPPRIAISELDMSLTCSEQLFQAINAEDLRSTIRENQIDCTEASELSVCQLVQALVQQVEIRGLFDVLKSLTAVNLFTLISGKSFPPQRIRYGKLTFKQAIHSVIYCQQTSFCLNASTLSTLRISLENWLEAWKVRKTLSDSRINKNSSLLESPSVQVEGFSRHAREYHSLACAKLDRLEKDMKEATVRKLNKSSINCSMGSMKEITVLMLERKGIFQEADINL
jgi:hypothetical protein